MQGERHIGGLGCGEVLVRLSDYLDGALSADERAKVDAHIAGCDACERFGGAFATAVKALRELAREEERA